MATPLTAFRFSEEDLARLDRFATAMNTNRSEALRALLPRTALGRLWEYVRGAGHAGTDYTAWFEQFVAESLRHRMLTDRLFPLAAPFIPRQPAAVIALYADFLEASDRARGVPPNPHYEAAFERAPDVRLEAVPGTGHYVVLADGQQLAADGRVEASR